MDQEFITNVKEMAFSTNNDNKCMPRPTFYSNAEESDNRVWLHCVHSQGRAVATGTVGQVFT